MTSYDAQTALDAIRHRQEQTRDEYVRHASSGAYGLVAALAIFAMMSSGDLPRPWSLFAWLVGGSLIAGGMVVQYRRARVRRKPSGAATLFTLWLGAVVIVVLTAATIAARLLELPLPSVTAAAVTALATLVATYASRPIVRKIAKKDDLR
ncbi:hypothetical protein AB0C96_01235 [Streptomyces sp. NPDC048506]|uniref:hypothetical protein n=1 Tax=Streptomyces sp. NPDC048506 TaxID=3155028 RepID=UPI0034474AE2